MEEGIFSHKLQVYYCDCDCKEEMKLSALLHCISDVAGIDYDHRGYTHAWLLEQGQVFLLSQVQIKMIRVPKPNEVITCRTWEVGTKGAVFLRDYRIEAESGEILAEAASQWLLVDPESRRVLRPKEFVGELKPIAYACAAKLPQRMLFEKEELTFMPQGVHTVRYSDIDLNGHTYNAKYADMAFDALRREDAVKPVRNFQIHFKKEAVLGDTIRIGFKREQNGVLLAGLLEGDVTCFTARIEWKE